MMNNIKITLFFLFSIVLIQIGYSKNPESSNKPQTTAVNSDTAIQLREDCAPARTQVDLEINNVRARLLVGGDVWWDKNNGRYIVPKVPVLSLIHI